MSSTVGERRKTAGVAGVSAGAALRGCVETKVLPENKDGVIK
jgi:hypothetical protein